MTESSYSNTNRGRYRDDMYFILQLHDHNRNGKNGHNNLKAPHFMEREKIIIILINTKKKKT